MTATDGVPVLMCHVDDETPCATCRGVLDSTTIVVGLNGRGALCHQCVDALPGGPALRRLAAGLEHIDSAVFAVPETLRPDLLAVAHDVLEQIAVWHRPREEPAAGGEQSARPTPACCVESGHPDGCPQHAQAVAVLDPRRARRRRRLDPGPATAPPDGPDAA
ncbi:hypothetical protein AB0873_09550 [Micromonospora sp. NPDC047707]|uniref:hypothetical protein n=1 Tax=Micromonospora sp. NPDC047707 TaxID=3154498 RepID=UPI003453039A